MKPQRVQPLEGALAFFASGMVGPSWQRTTKVSDTVTVDTSLPSDTHIHETGISRKLFPDEGGGGWIIVEQYEDEAAALVGHDKWAALMTGNPSAPLVDIDMWSLGNGMATN